MTLVLTPPAAQDFGDPRAAGTVPVAVATVPAATAAPTASSRPGAPPTQIVLRGAAAPVVPIRTDADGRLGVPDPPSTVGWWTPGALPGAASGTTVLAGHVDSRVAGLGAFAVLRDLQPGEVVALRDAAGRSLGYSVTARREFGKSQLPADLFTTGGPPRLVLITCGGEFDRVARSYADNVVVYAVPLR